VTAFTIQRFFIVYSPLARKFKKKSFGWRTTFVIIIISIIINLWALFLFKLKNSNNIQICDIDTDWVDIYYYISLFYNIFSMLVPMMIILVLNCLIIKKTYKNDKTRNQLQSSDFNETKKKISAAHLQSRRNAVRNSKIRKIKKKSNQSRNMSFALLLASFSFVLLNLPYFVTW
jgi:hypothetical protein